LAELVAAISLFTDLGTGQPQEQSIRTCVIAMRLADRLRLSHADRVTVYYATLLRFLGCTAGAHEAARLAGGDELAFYAALAPTTMGSGREEFAAMVRAVGVGTAPGRRLALIAAVATDRDGKQRILGPHCEVAARLAVRMGLPEGVATALAAAYARWDGRGVPAGVGGPDIPIAMRIAVVARDVELLLRAAAPDLRRILTARRGRAYDPALVDAVLDAGPDALMPEPALAWDCLMSTAPRPDVTVDGSGLDAVLVACADFADLKVPHLAGHSRGVADLAAAAAVASARPAATVDQVRRAGLVHDLGRVAIPAGIWMRTGELSAGDWEAVRLHPYYTERILARCAPLTDLAQLAGAHHERVGGSGYHRGRDRLDHRCALLAAADAYQAMTSPRPHRPALRPDEAAGKLRGEVSAGRLPRAEVDAVLAAATGRTARIHPAHPAGLTDREVQVLELLAGGLINRDIARALGISAKTVGRHIENLYAKAGVSSRAAAAVFAMEHDLLGR
jgi:HD-GYP domain-containing protein (c-di-GMP phosphodiesterase class II)